MNHIIDTTHPEVYYNKCQCYGWFWCSPSFNFLSFCLFYCLPLIHKLQLKSSLAFPSLESSLAFATLLKPFRPLWAACNSYSPLDMATFLNICSSILVFFVWMVHTIVVHRCRCRCRCRRHNSNNNLPDVTIRIQWNSKLCRLLVHISGYRSSLCGM